MHTAKTHTILHGLVAAALVVALSGPGAAAVKKTAYPEVKVTLDKPYKPDAAFEKMHTAFLDAVKRKDLQALTALVAPTFLWTVGDTPADELDLGRDAIHNFKVAFGFRGLGKDVDGGCGAPARCRPPLLRLLQRDEIRSDALAATRGTSSALQHRDHKSP
jgi:hypothetical protein